MGHMYLDWAVGIIDRPPVFCAGTFSWVTGIWIGAVGIINGPPVFCQGRRYFARAASIWIWAVGIINLISQKTFLDFGRNPSCLIFLQRRRLVVALLESASDPYNGSFY